MPASDAAEVESRMDLAGKFMQFNFSRHQQIVALRRQMNDLQLQARGMLCGGRGHQRQSA